MSELRSLTVFCLRRVLPALLWMAVPGAASAASGYSLLYSFPVTPPGANPVANVTFDASGNIYVVSSWTDGSVIELVRGGNGNWTEKTLYTFTGGSDGQGPWGGLIFDGKGNIFGTTQGGGITNCPQQQGCGTVFELTPAKGGGWTETIVYRFTGAPDGQWPQSGLALDSSGNLFGTTTAGGDDTDCNTRNVGYGCGTVFEISPGKGGTWSERVLYAFPGGHGNAFPLYGALVLDAAANLYGTTAGVLTGNEGRGTVFEMVRGAKGTWKHKILYQFPGGDGLEYPAAGVVFDAHGNLYGTTQGDTPAANCCGTVFELFHSQQGWREKTLHRFTGEDGAFPLGGVVFDKAGNLYAAPTDGGTLGECFAGCGTVVELSPTQDGWTESVLHEFGGSGDGYSPFPGLARYKDTFAGTTLWGGPNLYGTVYEIAP